MELDYCKCCGNAIDGDRTLTTSGSICFVCREALLEWASSNRFNPKTQVAIIWCIEDVKDIRPDLSDEQCMEVLRKACDEDHDSEYGVRWETLKDTARELFGDKNEK